MSNWGTSKIRKLSFLLHALQAVSLQSDNLLWIIFTEIRSGCELHQKGGCVSVRVDEEVTEFNGMLHILAALV